MVASCFRKSGNYAAALEKYKWIHREFPDNTECISNQLFYEKIEKIIKNFFFFLRS